MIKKQKRRRGEEEKRRNSHLVETLLTVDLKRIP
jgi:hypothetical protein